MQMLGTWLVAFQDIRPGGGRNPIGRRTESDRTADGIRSGGGRNPIGRRSKHDDKTQQSEQKKVAEVSGLRSTKSNTNCISALSQIGH